MEEFRVVLDKRKRKFGTYCLRCGRDKEKKRERNAGCYAGYGTWYNNHFYGRMQHKRGGAAPKQIK